MVIVIAPRTAFAIVHAKRIVVAFLEILLQALHAAAILIMIVEIAELDL